MHSTGVEGSLADRLLEARAKEPSHRLLQYAQMTEEEEREAAAGLFPPVESEDVELPDSLRKWTGEQIGSAEKDELNNSSSESEASEMMSMKDCNHSMTGDANATKPLEPPKEENKTMSMPCHSNRTNATTQDAPDDTTTDEKKDEEGEGKENEEGASSNEEERVDADEKDKAQGEDTTSSGLNSTEKTGEDVAEETPQEEIFLRPPPGEVFVLNETKSTPTGQANSTDVFNATETSYIRVAEDSSSMTAMLAIVALLLIIAAVAFPMLQRMIRGGSAARSFRSAGDMQLTSLGDWMGAGDDDDDVIIAGPLSGRRGGSSSFRSGDLLNGAGAEYHDMNTPRFEPRGKASSGRR